MPKLSSFSFCNPSNFHHGHLRKGLVFFQSECVNKTSGNEDIEYLSTKKKSFFNPAKINLQHSGKGWNVEKVVAGSN